MSGEEKRRVVLWIEYDGSDFHGWQFQPGQRTVQSDIETALSVMCKEKIRVIASGRTDAGVHSMGQVAHFDTTSRISPQKFRLGLNSMLERDVSVFDCREAVSPFHAQYDAVRKTYRYRILTRRAPSALRRNQVWHHRRKLDIDLMRNASVYFVGERDFASFCPENTEASSTVRRLDRMDVVVNEDEIWVEVTAEGFLRFMVRTIVGTLAEVGREEQLPDSIPEIFEARDRNRAGLKAPAQGLCLVCVHYGDKLPPPGDEGDAEEPET
ncbi:MAG: tRNA pseudouridine(38-40) synthase TruA [Nitrospinota bacterium]|jgi:tRNA pseudouridine38-40 synthase|nr:tRNA pseudouridine(38-40) synthase TruA [Nitrospinota bacterium]MDP7663412.1 tRNA pseudouridine(38-40) synthase TruA [Nitrospinota bacterium]